jgi:hypothetical protein
LEFPEGHSVIEESLEIQGRHPRVTWVVPPVLGTEFQRVHNKGCASGIRVILQRGNDPLRIIAWQAHYEKSQCLPRAMQIGYDNLILSFAPAALFAG